MFAVATWHRKRIKDGGCRDSVAPALYVRDTSQTTLWRHGLGTGNETGTQLTIVPCVREQPVWAGWVHRGLVGRPGMTFDWPNVPPVLQPSPYGCILSAHANRSSPDATGQLCSVLREPPGDNPQGTVASLPIPCSRLGRIRLHFEPSARTTLAAAAAALAAGATTTAPPFQIAT